MAVVQTGSLLSFTITSLVQLTRMGSLVGFLDTSKTLLGIAAGLGLARHFRVHVRTRRWSAHRSVTFSKNRPDDGVKWGHWSLLMLTSGRVYQKVSVDFSQVRHWGLAASGPLGC